MSGLMSLCISEPFCHGGKMAAGAGWNVCVQGRKKVEGWCHPYLFPLSGRQKLFHGCRLTSTGVPLAKIGHVAAPAAEETREVGNRTTMIELKPPCSMGGGWALGVARKKGEVATGSDLVYLQQPPPLLLSSLQPSNWVPAVLWSEYLTYSS